MNCSLYLKNVYFLLLIVGTTLMAYSQDATKKIYVSDRMFTFIRFDSPITHFEFENNDSSYICKLRGDNSLVIQTIRNPTDTTNLYIDEGTRKHIFTVVFIPNVNFNRTRFSYDFSDQADSEKKVDELSGNKITKSIPHQQKSTNNASTTKTDVKDKNIIANSTAAIPKFYTQAQLWLKYHNKYPSLVFDLPPEEQYLTGDYAIDRDTLENARVSYSILEDTPKMQQTSNTFDNINFVLQGIYFSTTNCYMRILIQNKSDDDYMVGIMNVRWYADSGKIYDAYPCFITSYPSRGIWTSFPVMPAGTEETIVLTTRALNVKEADSLSLTIGDRLKKVNLQLTIPGKEYLTIMGETK